MKVLLIKIFPCLFFGVFTGYLVGKAGISSESANLARVGNERVKVSDSEDSKFDQVPREVAELLKVELVEWEEITSRRAAFLKWFEEDPLRALTWAKAHGFPSGTRMDLGVAFKGWARTDIDRAVEHAKNLSSQTLRSAAFNGIARAVGENGIESAVEFCLDNPDAGETTAAELIKELAKDSPELAASVALKYSGALTAIFDSVVKTWVANDSRTALSWILGNLPSSEFRSTSVVTGVRELLKVDENAAMSVWSDLGKQERRLLLSDVAQKNFTKDPLATMGWIQSLPDDERILGESGMATAMALLGMEGSAMLNQVLRSAPSREMQMSLVNCYAEKAAEADDPQAILDAIRLIDDHEISERAVQSALFSIAYHKPEFAIEYVIANEITTSREVLLGIGSRSHKQASAKSFVSWLETLPENVKKPIADGWLKANRARLSLSSADFVKNQVE